jgi:hypothetical protein
VFVHVPLLAVSVAPDCGEPEIVGVPVLDGTASAAALPSCGAPITAPIAIAAIAITTAVGQRLKMVVPGMPNTPLGLNRNAIRGIHPGDEARKPRVTFS